VRALTEETRDDARAGPPRRRQRGARRAGRHVGRDRGGRPAALELLTDPVRTVDVAWVRALGQEVRHGLESAAIARAEELDAARAEAETARAALERAAADVQERLAALRERLDAVRGEMAQRRRRRSAVSGPPSPRRPRSAGRRHGPGS
jgi:hypothetical protein